jgi:uncharacterized membrane protein
MVSKKTLNALLISAVAISVAGASVAAHAEGEKEKCYGVVKAGKNDCAAANGAHACAASSTISGGGDEWVAVPKGLCDKLVNGSLTPTSAPVAAAPEVMEAPKTAEGEAH